MIKANELVWVKQNGAYFAGFWVDGEYEYAKICKIAGYIITNTKCELQLKNHGNTILIWSRKGLKSCFEAKSACQENYQSMLESMVDMGHLKSIILSAVFNGFWEGNAKDGDGSIDDLVKAQEEFLKTLEQERK